MRERVPLATTAGRRLAVWTAVCLAALLGLGSSAWSAAAPRYLNKRYSDAVHDLRHCLQTLPPREHRLAVLRSGIGPSDPVSRGRVAAELRIPLPSVSHAEWAGVRAMRRAQAAGRCGAQAAAAPRAKPPKKVVATVRPAPEPPVQDAPTWTDPAILILLGVATVSLVGLVREGVRVSRT